MFLWGCNRELGETTSVVVSRDDDIDAFLPTRVTPVFDDFPELSLVSETWGAAEAAVRLALTELSDLHQRELAMLRQSLQRSGEPLQLEHLSPCANSAARKAANVAAADAAGTTRSSSPTCHGSRKPSRSRGNQKKSTCFCEPPPIPEADCNEAIRNTDQNSDATPLANSRSPCERKRSEYSLDTEPQNLEIEAVAESEASSSLEKMNNESGPSESSSSMQSTVEKGRRDFRTLSAPEYIRRSLEGFSSIIIDDGFSVDNSTEEHGFHRRGGKVKTMFRFALASADAVFIAWQTTRIPQSDGGLDSLEALILLILLCCCAAELAVQFKSRIAVPWCALSVSSFFVALMLVELVLLRLCAGKLSTFVKALMRALRVVRVFHFVLAIGSCISELNMVTIAIKIFLKRVCGILLATALAAYSIGVLMAQGSQELCVGGGGAHFWVHVSHDHSRGASERDGDELGNFPHMCSRFGTVARSAFSFYEAVVGGMVWSEVIEDLQELHVFYGVSFVCFVVFGSLVLLNIVFHLIFDAHARSSRRDLKRRIVEEVEAKAEYAKIFSQIFALLDSNGSGAISMLEMQIGAEDNAISALLASVNLKIYDVQELFQLLDRNGNGSISPEEFVLGSLRLREDVSVADMMSLYIEVSSVRREINALRLALDVPLKTALPKVIDNASSKFDRVMCFRDSDAKLAVRNQQTFFEAFYDDVLHMSHGVIDNIADRAMSLQELRNLRAEIKLWCPSGSWHDQKTGKRLLKAETLTLYHLSYNYILPLTAVGGIVLEGICLSSFEYQEDALRKGRTVRQRGSSQSTSDWVMPSAEGSIVEVDMNRGELKVIVLRGKFEVGIDLFLLDDRENEIMCGKPTGVVINAVSYKEIVSSDPLPAKWYCSHWWGDVVFDFVACCEEHAQLRQLSDKDARYWVCAYANRQHQLGCLQDGFVSALNKAEGLLLILDKEGQSLTRLWCCFEIYTVLDSGQHLLDIVTLPTNADKPHFLTASGGISRTQHFPTNLLALGMRTKLEDGATTVPADKTRILDYMASSASCREEAYEKINVRLNALFAWAAWPVALRRGRVMNFDRPKSGIPLRLPDVTCVDIQRETLTLDMAHMSEVTDLEVEMIADGLPPQLVNLSLSFANCQNITDLGLVTLSRYLGNKLRVLSLDFLGCTQITDLGFMTLVQRLPVNLNEVTLDFAKCSDISEASVMEFARRLTPCIKSFRLLLRGTKVNRNFDNFSSLQRYAKGGGLSSRLTHLFAAGDNVVAQHKRNSVQCIRASR